MSDRPEKRLVEMIESYWTGGEYGSDYKWNDNHGELVRCKYCKHRLLPENETRGECMARPGWFPVDDDWYCADGKRRDEE